MIKPAPAEQVRSPSQAQEVVARLSELAALDTHELRSAWRRHTRMAPPKGLSRDMLIRAMAYAIQERAFGGLTKSTLRRLATLARTLDSPEGMTQEPYPSLKPGTKLVREWGGATHTVLVLDGGFEYLGRHYASLTGIAGVITGLHRSGPMFFGLKRAQARFGGRSRASKSEGVGHE